MLRGFRYPNSAGGRVFPWLCYSHATEFYAIRNYLLLSQWESCELTFEAVWQVSEVKVKLEFESIKKSKNILGKKNTFSGCFRWVFIFDVWKQSKKYDLTYFPLFVSRRCFWKLLSIKVSRTEKKSFCYSNKIRDNKWIFSCFNQKFCWSNWTFCWLN